MDEKYILKDVEYFRDGHHGQSPPPPYGKDHRLSSQIITSITAEGGKDENDRVPEQLPNDWKDFIDYTTFHGIKHIFEKSPVRFRGGLWCVCVLFCACMLVGNVAFRIADYYRHNTNVDVQVNYTSALSFPAVTFCNQNNFRMSVAVKEGMYQYIQDVFGKSTTDFDFSEYRQFDNISSYDFLRRASHQLENLVDSCHWNSEECDLKNDFRKVVTDMGICYTFNHDIRNIKFSKASGQNSGLKLVLNVEQYEAMRGPQNDAGVRILLHPPDHFPAVRDLGFSVSPGTHTLVGVQRREFVYLEPPWGTCSMSAIPRSNCTIQCERRLALEYCGCNNNHLETDHFCPLSTLWGCVRNLTDISSMISSNCQCESPCNGVIFNPILSSSKLSQINIDRIVLQQRGQKDNFKNMCATSLETLQRVDEDIMTKDCAAIADILNNFAIVRNLTDEAAEIFKENSTLFVDLLEVNEAMKNDEFFLRNLDDKLIELSAPLDRENLFLITKVLSFLKFMVSREENTFELEHDVLCANMTSITFPVKDETKLEEIKDFYKKQIKSPKWDPMQFAQQHLNDSFEEKVGPDASSDCNARIESKIYLAQQYHILLNDFFNFSLNSLSIYKDIIHRIYSGSGRDANSQPKHKECLIFLSENYVADMIDKLKSVVEVLDIYKNSKSKQILGDNMVLLVERVNETHFEEILELMNQLEDKCYWITDIIHSKDFQMSYQMSLRFYSDAIDQVEKAIQAIGLEMTAGNMRLLKTVNGIVFNLMENILAFKGNNKTKIDMAKELTSLQAKFAFQKLMDDEQEFERVYDDFVDLFNEMNRLLKKAFTDLTSSKIPVLTINNLKEIQMFQLIQERHPLMWQQLIANNSLSKYPVILSIIDGMTYHCKGPKVFGSGKLENAVRFFISSISEYQAHLENYKQSAVINSAFLLDNFLQVDIFYTELSYEMFMQHKAFELCSLVAEIGGSLGLLLGASILSVVEFFDHVILLAMRKMHFRRLKRTQIAAN